MTTHVLSPGVAAAVPVKACHRCDRTNFKHLAEYIAGRLPSTLSTSSVISQHRVPLALSGEVRFVPIWNPFTYLCFLKFRNSYYVRSRFLCCTFDRFFSLAMMGPSLGYSSRPGQQLGPASPVLSYDRYDSECRKFA